eukprot:jgi/Mesvir1/16579/Mv10115-RA.1
MGILNTANVVDHFEADGWPDLDKWCKGLPAVKKILESRSPVAELAVKTILNARKDDAELVAPFLNWMACHVNPPCLRSIVIPYYAKCLKRILTNAPPLTKPMTVYRGSETAYYTDDPNESKVQRLMLKGQALRLYRNNFFVSTSINPNKALDFTQIGDAKKDGCCLKVIQLLPGVTCLPLWPVSHYADEFEILLPPDVVFQIRGTRRAEVEAPKSLKWGLSYQIDGPCPGLTKRFPDKRIRVSEIVIAPSVRVKLEEIRKQQTARPVRK